MKFMLVLIALVAYVAADCQREHDQQQRFVHGGQNGDKVEEPRRPSDQLHELCQAGQSHHKHARYTIEFLNFDKVDCLDAVKYAKQHEQEDKEGEWLIYREFKCGKMIVKIDQVN